MLRPRPPRGQARAARIAGAARPQVGPGTGAGGGPPRLRALRRSPRLASAERRPRVRGALPLLAAALLVAACAPAPPRPAPETQAVGAAEREAAALRAAGDATGAARRYLEAARTAPAAARPRLLLAAARAWLEAGNPREALAALPDVRPEWSRELRRAAHQVRAEAYLAAGNPLEAARERLAEADLAPGPDGLTAALDAAWEALQRLPGPYLRFLAETTAEPRLRGWLELAAAARTHPPGPAAEAALAAWLERHPGHEAAARAQALREQLGAPRGVPRRIALLLPLSGPYAEAGRAVRDGFLAAWYADLSPDERPPVRVLDTGGRPEAVWPLYRQAVEGGATLVVGPLRKEAVAELARAGSLEVPVLALNRAPPAATAAPARSPEAGPGPATKPAAGQAAPAPAPDTQGEARPSPPERLYQFGLAPEDEAAQAAERAIVEGWERALVLVPEGPWGERVAAAFARRLTELGGTVLEAAAYPRQGADFAPVLRPLLNLDESAARRARLARILGRRLAFEPRRRRDVQAIFMAAFPRAARLLKPQLDFHRASGVPVLATSHVYAGTPDPERDRDLDGILFCDLPWLLDPGARHPLRARIGALWPERAARYPRLFALGVDAFRIAPYLPDLEAGLGPIPAATGDLTLTAGRTLSRRLRWARFRRGRPVPADEAMAEPDRPHPAPH